MNKNIVVLLIIFLATITSWAGSTKDAVENLNRSLPLDSGTERVLAKIIYDEMNNIVLANYLTSWQNLVQMRKMPDFDKKAANEVLDYIFQEDMDIKPFTLIVNYFADEAGFEDLAKSYFITPGQVGSMQRTVQKNMRSHKREQTRPQKPQETPSAEPKVDEQLQTLASRLADFKGFADPQNRFQIARYYLSTDQKDINILVLASEEAIPFFIDEQYAPIMSTSMSQRLASQFPDLEPILSTRDLNVVIYAADLQGHLKGQYKYPASQVFAKEQKENAQKGKAKDNDKSKKKDKKDKNKDKSKKPQSPEQPVAQQESTSSETQEKPEATTQNPSEQSSSSQTEQPASQRKKAATEQPASESGQLTAEESSTKKGGTPEEMLQQLTTLYQALLPQKMLDGIKLSQMRNNKDVLLLLLDIDGEKYPESSNQQIRELLIKNVAAEFGKKKSMYPLLFNLCCQTSRQVVFVLSSKDWTNSYPMPLDPCTIVQSFKNRRK